MPIYEYECGGCHHRFELKQSFSAKPEAACPKCKKKSRRVFHPAPIIFKGSGFYVTDHKGANPASNHTAEKGETKKTSESSSGKKETKSS